MTDHPTDDVRGRDSSALAAAADDLRSLHRPGEPLVLVNTWDAASARRVEAAGGRAIGTSSAAVAASLGVPDDRGAPVAAMFDAVARISAAVALPVTADLLDGYGLAPDELVERLLAAGAVGCNIEDSDHLGGRGLVDPQEMADRVAGVREAAARAGVPVVVNARVDVLLQADPDRSDLQGEIVDRARRYLAAGADCAYPVRLVDPAMVATVTGAVPGPVNANLGPGATVAGVAAAGAARVSIGPTGQAAALAAFDDVAARLLAPAAGRV